MASSNDSPSSRRRFIKQNWQLIYASILILLVSVIVVANTLFVIGRFRNIVEVGLQQTALTMGKMFDVLGTETADDPSVLQERSQKVATALPEIVSLDILAKDGADFFVVASLYEAGIGRLTRDEKNIRVWNENRSLTYLTENPRSVSTDLKPTSDEIQNNQRFGGVIVPLHNKAGQISYLLSAKISSAATDPLLRSGLFWSYAWLAMTLLVVILILILNTRLFQYIRLQKCLREVAKMKDDFVTMAASELQAPLTAVRSNLSLLLEGAFGKLDKKPQEIINITRSLSDRLEALVEDLLYVSRLEQDHIEFKPKNIDAENIIEEVVEQLQQQAKNKSLRLEYRRLNYKLPQICVDPQQLKQALINICSNAIKFTPSGEITIISLINDSQWVEIKIIDTGIGLTAEQQATLFTKLHRIKTEQTQDIPGAGLGLWITKRLIEKMGGKIFIDSIEKIGTQVSLIFPAVKPLSNWSVSEELESALVKQPAHKPNYLFGSALELDDDEKLINDIPKQTKTDNSNNPDH